MRRHTRRRRVGLTALLGILVSVGPAMAQTPGSGWINRAEYVVEGHELRPAPTLLAAQPDLAALKSQTTADRHPSERVIALTMNQYEYSRAEALAHVLALPEELVVSLVDRFKCSRDEALIDIVRLEPIAESAMRSHPALDKATAIEHLLRAGA